MSEDERLIRNDPAIREIAQMVTNYCASCVELEARATAAEAENARLAGENAALAELVAELADDLKAEVQDRWGYDERLAHKLKRDMDVVVRARAALESRNVG